MRHGASRQLPRMPCRPCCGYHCGCACARYYLGGT